MDAKLSARGGAGYDAPPNCQQQPASLSPGGLGSLIIPANRHYMISIVATCMRCHLAGTSSCSVSQSGQDQKFRARLALWYTEEGSF